MDAMTAQLAEFAAGLRWTDIPSEVRAAARSCLFDSIGCAVGGSRTETAKIAQRLAPTVSDGPRGRMIGSASPTTTLEAAAFANGVMIRELDFNDYYPGGHPSDQLGPLLAAAEFAGVDGTRLLTAMTVAYEIFIRFAKFTPLKQRGWDQGFGVCIGTAAALGNLLGLSEQEIGHAISIAGVAHLPLRATKAGELSAWKGAATAHAARSTLSCTLLAAEGVTGPEALFEGRDGVWEVVTGPFEFPPFGRDVADFFTQMTTLKYWPLCGGLLAPVAAAMELHETLSIDDMESIEVATHRVAVSLNGSDAPKWDPQTRETADHSLPYAVVRVLADGRFDATALEPEEFKDPVWRPLMQRVSVTIGEDIEARYPEDIGARLTAVDRHGETHVVEAFNPPGHERNPLTPEQVRDKFYHLLQPVVGEDQALAAADFWESLDEDSDLSTGFKLLEFSSTDS